MQHNWLLYIAAFATSFGISLLFTPYAKKIAIYVGAIDLPKKRGMHNKPIPRMGGIAIVLGFIGTVIILAPFVKEFRSIQFIGFLIGAILIVTIGILDDIYSAKSDGVKARIKLAVQIVAALIVIFTGTTLEFVNLQFKMDLTIIGMPITFLWIIGITNAVNLIDGLDGLAAGVSGIAALFLAVLCIMSGSIFAVVLTVALAGSCLGFLPRNFSPAEIIMGDTGALFLGYILAVTSIMGVYKKYALLSLIVCAIVLALPIVDTVFAMGRRILSGKSIMQADRGHLHHKLVDSGLSASSSVVILYCISFIAGIFAILIAVNDVIASSIAIILFLILSTVVHVYRKRISSKNDKKEL
jgi:UDP-GlcNAc:undecaprenyl-phosphate/decaprenyl-phosphate GlcNAc-1-phosphate transferase